MADKKVVAKLATSVGLDTTDTVQALDQLVSSVKNATSSWKAQVAMAKSSGDAVEAAKAKYEGLSDAVEKQKAVIDRLKETQDNLDRSTKEGQASYDKLGSKIATASNKLSSMSGQLDRATKSYDYQKSGLAGITSSLRDAQKVTQSYVERLQAEGKEAEANKAKLTGLQDSHSKLASIYSKQVSELEKLQSAEHKDDSAIATQQERINKTATAMAKASTEAKDLREQLSRKPETPFTSIRNKLLGVSDAEKKADKSSKTFSDTLKGSFIGNALSNALSNITGSFKNIISQGIQIDETGEQMNSTWEQLGLKKNDIKWLSNEVGDLKKQTGFAGTEVNGLQKQFYGLTGSVGITENLTRGASALAVASGKGAEGAEAISSGFMKVQKSGKLTSAIYSKMAKSVPALPKQLAKALNMSQDQLKTAVANGSISSQQFQNALTKIGATSQSTFDQFGKTAQGSLAQFKGSWQQVEAATAKPILSVKNTGLEAVTKVLNSKATQSLFTNLGKAIANLATQASKLLGYIAAHQKDLSSLIGSLSTILKLLVVGAWNTFKGAVELIARAFNNLTGNSKKASNPIKNVSNALGGLAKHKTTVKVIGGLLLTAFASKKLLNGVRSLYGDFLSLKHGLDILRNSTLLQAAAQRVLNAVQAAGPFMAVIAVIVALGAALFALYKHNARFRAFVNSIIAAAKRMAKGLINFIKPALKFVGNLFDDAGKYWADSFGNAMKVIGDIFKIFKDVFTGNWKGLGRDVKGLWRDMWRSVKDLGKDGMNMIIDVINGGIGLIDGVIHTFGGSSDAIKKISKFAKGTAGAPKGIAMVNDEQGVADPREAIIDRNQDVHILSGKNRLVNFEGGETVVPASATHQMFPHFEDGTENWLTGVGHWFKDKWDALTGFIKDPLSSLQKVMDKAVDSMMGGKSSFVQGLAPALGHGFVQGIIEPIKKLFDSLKKKHDDEEDGGGFEGGPAGAGVQRWADLVKKALDANHLSTSDSMVQRVLRQIQTESGGNNNARQPGADPDGDGSGPALGLMQTKRSTFNHYAFPGHSDIFNGYDDLLAGLAYAKARYGSSLSFLGNGHGYHDGGLVSNHQLIEVAEGNLPEMIVPLIGQKSRANQLLAQASRIVNGNSSARTKSTVTNNYSTADNSKVEALLEQNNSLIAMLINVAKGNGFNMQDFGQAANGYQSLRNFQNI
ncbi:tape measure protein [Furfurilactobacillus milii]|nr:tape measure protein [Furfurilactobacillus milii]